MSADPWESPPFQHRVVKPGPISFSSRHLPLLVGQISPIEQGQSKMKKPSKKKVNFLTIFHLILLFH